MTIGINGSKEYKNKIKELESIVNDLKESADSFGDELNELHDYSIGTDQEEWDRVLSDLMDNFVEMEGHVVYYKKGLSELVDESSVEMAGMI